MIVRKHKKIIFYSGVQKRKLSGSFKAQNAFFMKIVHGFWPKRLTRDNLNQNIKK